MALMPISRDVQSGAAVQMLMVRIYLLTGQLEHALDLLEPLFPVYTLSAERLRIDPVYAPLRGNPRFERLARGTS